MRSLASRWAAWEAAGSRVSQESPLAPITFPTTPLRLRVQLAIGADVAADPASWSWYDITDYVRYDNGNGVRVNSSGRRDESTVVTASQASLMIDNRDGRFSRRDPSSPYYGMLTMNTPIWVEVDPGDGGHTRYQGFVNSWPKRWPDKSLNDTYVPIGCSGILRRLQQNTDSKSALKRTILAAGPVAYWTLEDDASSTSAGSSIPGGAALKAITGVTFGSDTGPAGSDSLPAAGAFLSGQTLMDSATTIAVEFIIKVEPAASLAGRALRWHMDSGDFTGGHATFVHNAGHSDPNSAEIVVGLDIDSASTNLVTDDLGDIADGEFHHIRFEFVEGVTIDATLWVDGVQVDTGSSASGTTLGRITQIYVNSQRGAYTDLAVMGHVAIYEAATSDHSDAMDGYDGEEAHTRLARLCDEDGVRYTSLAATSEEMGTQDVASFISLIRECEAADIGVLYEADWGLAYQSRTERYNQPVGMTLDLSQAEIAEEPEVDDDDQNVANSWTVNRTSGSHATAEDSTGPMGTAAIGLWDRSATVNVATDDQLPDQASWRLHTTTVDEDRWPRVAVAMHHDPDLIGAWTALGYGARMQIDNPPEQAGPNTIDLIIEGHTERINQFLWDASLNAAPASPYNVSVLAETSGDTNPLLGWLDWDSCELLAAINSSATSVIVNALPTDTTTADDFPRDVYVGGELLTVTASAVTCADAFGRSESNGWGSTDTGSYAWTAAGGSASDFSVASGTGRHSMGTVNASRRCTLPTSLSVFDTDLAVTITVPEVATGGSMQSGFMIAYVDSSNFYEATIAWATGGTATIHLITRIGAISTTITSAGIGNYAAASTWKLRAGISGGELRARAWPTAVSEPGVWQVSTAVTPFTAAGLVGIRTILLTGNTNVTPVFEYDNFAIESLRTWTATRSVNGTVKSHSAGADCTIANPFVLAL